MLSGVGTVARPSRTVEASLPVPGEPARRSFPETEFPHPHGDADHKDHACIWPTLKSESAIRSCEPRRSHDMRIHSLQGVRAICISLVLLAHVAGTRNFPGSRILEAYGNPGVRIFLILSGYLITSQLIKEKEMTGSISLCRFYTRRAYRIFPAAYVFMAIVIATHSTDLTRANILT